MNAWTKPVVCAILLTALAGAPGVAAAGQTVTTGTARKSALKSVTHLDGQLLLQGGENGRGWSMTIDEDTGRMAVAIVDHDYTFSLFGACTLP